MSNERTRSEWLADYEDYRAAYGYKKLSDDAIHLFLRWCERNCPGNGYFTQEMIDLWGVRRDTETDWTHSGRAAALNGLLRYINDRGDGPFRLIEYNWAAGSPEPVLFTQEELKNFFRAVDEYTPFEHPKSRRTTLCSQLNAIQLPVLFRLLYSSGIRINEGRWLHREDVDLERGVLYIRRTKGYIERLVALHPTMTALLREYDAKIRVLMPEAVPYFPVTKYGEDYAVALRISREYRIGRIYDVLYNCRRWTGNSDAALDVVSMNRNNLYKDRIRTWELQARIAANAAAAGTEVTLS